MDERILIPIFFISFASVVFIYFGCALYDGYVNQDIINNAEISFENHVVVEIKHYTESLEYPIYDVIVELITETGQVIGTNSDDFKVGGQYKMEIFGNEYNGKDLLWVGDYSEI